MGKMIDAQSIVRGHGGDQSTRQGSGHLQGGALAQHLPGGHRGLLTLVQAYVFPFTLLVPHLAK